MGSVPYKNIQAITYAKTYCGQQDNSCGVYLQGGNSDCLAARLAESQFFKRIGDNSRMQ